MKKLEKKHILSLMIVIVICLILGASYALMTVVLNGQKEQVIHVKGLEITLDESTSNGISLQQAVPTTDEDGKKQVGYIFSIKNEGYYNSDYQIYLDDLDIEEGKVRLADRYVKYQLIKNNEEVGLGLLNTTGENPNRLLNEGLIERGKTDTYTLKVWIDYDATTEIMGQVFYAHIRVEASQNRLGVDTLLAKANQEDLDYNSATSEQQKEMWTFSHTAGAQQAGWTSEELTDYRYIGKDPNNYITFNDEVWRIIGVFTTEDSEGNKTKRIKIIRKESFEGIKWDSNGTNDWSIASVNGYLNSGEFYQELTTKAKKWVDIVKYYLGSTLGYTTQEEGLVSHFYGYERGTTPIYNGKNILWLGQFGLLYPSDYGYAASKGEQDCSQIRLYYWQYNPSCKDNNWLYDKTSIQWTITPHANIDAKEFAIMGTGSIDLALPTYGYAVRPVAYLKPNTQLTGSGTSTDPYGIKE